MKKILFSSLVYAAFVACGPSSDKPVAADSADSVNLPVKTAIAVVTDYRPNIDLTPWEGNLSDALYWTDSRGENVLVISALPQYFWADEKPAFGKKLTAEQDPETYSEVAEIFARHYVLRAGEAKWVLKYEYSDFIVGCCDVWLEYQKKSLGVHDADSNGTGEVIFMYHETEGDGKIGNLWTGSMVLLSDSAHYVSSGGTAMNSDSPQDVANAKPVFAAPASTIYQEVVKSEWDRLYAGWIQILRDEITERNNVDADGHADHSH